MKNDYEMLNDTKVNLEQYEESDLSEFEVRRVSKAVKKRIRIAGNNANKTKRLYVAVAVLCISTITIGLTAALLTSGQKKWQNIIR